MQNWINTWTNLGFVKGNVDSNLYLRKNEYGLLIVVVFMDDIIFGGNDEARRTFSKEMKKEFEMSMIGEIKYFLGLHFFEQMKFCTRCTFGLGFVPAFC